MTSPRTTTKLANESALLTENQKCATEPPTPAVARTIVRRHSLTAHLVKAAEADCWGLMNGTCAAEVEIVW